MKDMKYELAQDKIRVTSIEGFTLNEVIKLGLSAYLGISIDNQRYREKDSIVSILGWISKNFRDCQLLIGDYLHRHNLLDLNNQNEDTSIEYVTLKANLIRENIQKVKQKNKLSSVGGFLNWEAFHKDSFFTNLHKQFREIYYTNGVFHDAIKKDVERYLQFIEKKNKDYHRQTLLSDQTILRERSTAYLIEEMAGFAYLSQKGMKINIYAGSQLATTKMLVLGKIPGLSAYFEGVILVELKFKPKI